MAAAINACASSIDITRSPPEEQNHIKGSSIFGDIEATGRAENEEQHSETAQTQAQYGAHSSNISIPISDTPMRDETEKMTQVEEPVVFVDPMGARWELPCLSVKATLFLLLEILSATIPNSWYSRRFEMWEGDKADKRVSMVKRSDRDIINPDAWNQTMKPGMEFELVFAGETALVQSVLVAVRDEVYRDVVSAEIGYVAAIYQHHNGGNYPDAAHQTSATVLSEIRNVYLHPSKRAVSKSDGYAEINRDDIMGTYTLRIESTILLECVKAVLRFCSPFDNFQDQGFEFTASRQDATRFRNYQFPFADLYWHMDDLKMYSKRIASTSTHSDDYNQQSIKQIGFLLQYLCEQPTINLSRAEKRWNQPVPTCDFNTLWILMKPGAEVLVRERDQLNAYIVERVEGISASPTEKSKGYTVKVWSIDFDGERLGQCVRDIVIPVFDDEREITMLPVFPLRFYKSRPEAKTLRDTLIERGKNFVRVVTHPTYQDFTGSSKCYIGRKYNQSRVIVDHSSRPWVEELGLREPPHIPVINYAKEQSRNKRNPRCECEDCSKLDMDFSSFDENVLTFHDPSNFSDRQFLVCCSHVYIFVLQDRCWDFVDVTGLNDPKINSKIIDSLVIKPQSNKYVVKAICETYTQPEAASLFFADNVRGKGEGQIILLHGPPGTGKTLTAESIAEYVGRPLLSITGADLGHEPVVLEKNLLKYFRNASKWDAIVLLDEADIYLERRSVNDLQRNSIVTVFLRALDYFQGILFLTTNRVGSFDEAFMSRIHIQIGYDPLDDDSRKQIWMNNFKKLGEHERNGRRIEYAYSAKEFVMHSTALKSLEWNGHEIRNAFQTAVALACYEAKQNNELAKVTEDHFNQIVEMSTKFKKYMKAALQTDDATFAFRNRLRADKFAQSASAGKD